MALITRVYDEKYRFTLFDFRRGPNWTNIIDKGRDTGWAFTLRGGTRWSIVGNIYGDPVVTLVEGEASSVRAAKGAAIEALNSGAVAAAERRLKLAGVVW